MLGWFRAPRQEMQADSGVIVRLLGNSSSRQPRSGLSFEAGLGLQERRAWGRAVHTIASGFNIKDVRKGHRAILCPSLLWAYYSYYCW